MLTVPYILGLPVILHLAMIEKSVGCPTLDRIRFAPVLAGGLLYTTIVVAALALLCVLAFGLSSALFQSCS